jgi:hypothetical protein
MSVFISGKRMTDLTCNWFSHKGIPGKKEEGINRREMTPQSLVTSSKEAEILESPSPFSPGHYYSL